MNYEKVEEQLAKKISSILQMVCPAFHRTNSGAVEWHYCQCKADGGNPCTCVWHHTDTCIAGTWSELSFVRNFHKAIADESASCLAKAKSATMKS